MTLVRLIEPSEMTRSDLWSGPRARRYTFGALSD